MQVKYNEDLHEMNMSFRYIKIYLHQLTSKRYMDSSEQSDFIRGSPRNPRKTMSPFYQETVSDKNEKKLYIFPVHHY